MNALECNFSYNQLFRTPYEDYGCVNFKTNQPFFSDKTSWDSILVPGDSNKTIYCMIDSPAQQNGFRVSEPIISPPTREICSPAIRSRNITVLENITKTFNIPKIKVMTKEKSLLNLILDRN